MKQFLLTCQLLLIGCGCEFDSGSSSYSKAIGKSFSQQCVSDNISHLDDYSITESNNGSYEISRNGVKSIIEIEIENGIVSGYTIKTKTDKSRDKHLHEQIENSIIDKC